MFSRNSKQQAAKPNGGTGQAPTKPSPPSIISADLHVTGDLRSDGEIQIDGTMDGDIHTRSLLVGETARIRGQIVADTIRVHGSVEGQIKARSVSLAKKAHVIGDILHEDLSIENGAFLEGHCKRVDFPKEKGPGQINLIIKDDPTGTADASKGLDNAPKKAAIAPA